jgi:hypothetical protein
METIARDIASVNLVPPHSKSPAQRERILSLLRARGLAGASNVELNAIAFRYGGRIHELRRIGYCIETRRESENLFRFIFIAEAQKAKPPSTFDQRRREKVQREAPLLADVAHG